MKRRSRAGGSDPFCSTIQSLDLRTSRRIAQNPRVRDQARTQRTSRADSFSKIPVNNLAQLRKQNVRRSLAFATIHVFARQLGCHIENQFLKPPPGPMDAWTKFRFTGIFSND